MGIDMKRIMDLLMEIVAYEKFRNDALETADFIVNLEDNELNILKELFEILDVEMEDEYEYIYYIADNLDDLIGPQILRLTDYLSNDLAYDPETVINNDGATNEDYGWTNIRNVTDQTINYNDREGTFPGLNGYDENDPYWSEDAYDEIQGFNQVLATDYFKDMKFEEKIAKLQVSRILSNTADEFGLIPFISFKGGTTASLLVSNGFNKALIGCLYLLFFLSAFIETGEDIYVLKAIFIFSPFPVSNPINFFFVRKRRPVWGLLLIL